jgi:DNA-directed RNA polymerase specialized sigma subunit
MDTTAVSRGRKRASGVVEASVLRPATEASVLRPEASELFEQHYLLACHIAHTARVTMDIDDRVQECSLALWECCVNYIPRPDCLFWAWASKRVHGALIDAFRRITKFKPRTWRVMELRASGLTTTEVGRALGISEARVSQLLSGVLDTYAFGKVATRSGKLTRRTRLRASCLD